MRQKFGQGDIAKLGSHRVKVLACFLDENGEWWYEVEGLDIDPGLRWLTREVPQDALEEL